MNLFELSMERFKFGKTINIVECFSGIGTQAMAWKRLAKKYDLTLNFMAISEIDKFAIQSYESIHGKTPNLGGIGSFERFPSGIDFCSWSFPCQDISLAGKQKGMDPGSRSNYGYVFLDTIANTPKEERPKVLLMENVPALVSEKFKEDYAEIHRRLEEMGYTSWGGLLNAKDFGIPQNRERIFVVSILGEYLYTFPKEIPLKTTLSDYLESEVDERYYLKASEIKKLVKVNENYSVLQGGKWDKMHDIGKRVYNGNYISPTIHTMGGGNLEPKIAVGFGNKRINQTLEKHKIKQTTVVDGYNKTIHTELMPTITARIDASGNIVQAIPEATKQGYAIAEVGDGVYIDRPHQKMGVVQKGMIQTIKTQGKDVGVVVLDGELVRVRKLTPKECWRLMGISDEDFDKVSGMSNAQLYKQAGNAIVVDVLEKIFEQFLIL